LIDTTQLHYGHASGLLWRHAGAEVVVDVHLQMTLEFGVEFAFASVFEKQSFESRQPGSKFSHD
jgi:hypothetical protein